MGWTQGRWHGQRLPRSRCREPYLGPLAAIRGDLHGLQGEFHYLVEHRPGYLVAEIVRCFRVLHVHGHHQLRVARRADPDVAGAEFAQAAAAVRIRELRGPGLGGDRVAGDDAPWHAAPDVDHGHLLENVHQPVRRPGRQHPSPPRPGGGHELPAAVGTAGDDRRLDPDSLVSDDRVEAGHLDGVDRDALAERERVAGNPAPLGWPGQDPGTFTGQAEPGRRSDAQLPEVLILNSGADVLDHLDHAVVARVRQDARDGVVDGRV